MISTTLIITIAIIMMMIMGSSKAEEYMSTQIHARAASAATSMRTPKLVPSNSKLRSNQFMKASQTIQAQLEFQVNKIARSIWLDTCARAWRPSQSTFSGCNILWHPSQSACSLACRTSRTVLPGRATVHLHASAAPYSFSPFLT